MRISIHPRFPLALLIALHSLGLFGDALPSNTNRSFLAQAWAQTDRPLAAEIPVEICVNLPDWQRPSSQMQQKQLQAMERYGPALVDESLASTIKDWWSHELFSFTTYGLSARTDPLYLSGIWTALEATWNCYSGSQPEHLNNGDLAEVWLLHHRLVGLQWQDNQYVMTVERTNSGLQFVQFPRREREQELPLTLINTAGEPLAVWSGDW